MGNGQCVRLCDGMGRQTDTNFDDQTIAHNFVRSYFDFCIAIITKSQTINEWGTCTIGGLWIDMFVMVMK